MNIKLIKKLLKKKKKVLIDLLKNEYDLENLNLIGDFQKKNLLMAIKACEIIGLNKNKL